MAARLRRLRAPSTCLMPLGENTRPVPRTNVAMLVTKLLSLPSKWVTGEGDVMTAGRLLLPFPSAGSRGALLSSRTTEALATLASVRTVWALLPTGALLLR